MIRSRILSLAVLLAFVPLVSSRADEVDVYLLSGQSNMQGAAKIAQLPDDVPREIPNAWFFNGEQFEPMVIGKTPLSKQATNFGPEVGFALEMATAEKPVYLIKYAASGMPLHHGLHGGEWQGNEPAPGRRNFYPGQSPDDPNRGTLYRQMLRTFEAGIQSLKDDGHTPRLRGFVWMQGEQDAKHEIPANEYAKSLKQLRNRLARDLDVEKLPMAFGQVLPFKPAPERFVYRQVVREQMEKADGKSGDPLAIADAAMVSTDDCTLNGDHVHYDTPGQLVLGRKLAAGMQGVVE
jgi:hypothetical protein